MRRWLAVVAVICVVTAVVASGCGLPRSGTLRATCSAAVECDDQNPCTIDGCSPDGLCEHEPDELAELPQQNGDCQDAVCVDGLPGSQPNDGDLPEDDNPCTSDTCNAGVPKNAQLPEEAPCAVNGNDGRCVGGTCAVDCTPETALEKCDDGEACTVDSCDAALGRCEHMDLDGVPAPGTDQLAGDCQLKLCEAGKTVSINDNSDLPVDGNECTDDVCTEGKPSNPARPVNTACTNPNTQAPTWFCTKDTAQCVECTEVGQCPVLPGDPDCHEPTCNNNACGQDLTPVDTATTAQTVGDCQLTVCDGNGGTKQNVKDDDLPEDNNDCTKNLCVGGVIQLPPEQINFPCGAQGKLYCDGNKSCVGCTEDKQCNADTFCRDWSCDAQSKTCKAKDTPNNTPLPPADQVTGDCQEKRCDGKGNVKQSNITDPVVDGNQCTKDLCQSGTPLNPNEPSETSCNQNGGAFCDGGGSCVECIQNTHCSGALDCQTDVCNASNACQIDPEPKNTPAPQLYQTTGDCNLVVCDGAGNVDTMNPVVQDSDKPVDGNQCTKDVCASGVASNPEEPAETSCNQNNGKVCNGDPQNPKCVECATNNQCTPPDVCELSSWSCCTPDTCGSLAKTCGSFADGCGGMVMCSGMKNGAETDVDCGGPASACTSRCAQGKDCSQNTDCLSGLCADGVCCDKACGGACEACDLAGKVGTCTLVPDTQDPDNECPNGSCNGNGACLTDDGFACAGGSECRSAICTDGFCCDAVCGSACQACDVAGKLGVCSNVPQGTDPHTDCGGGQACDGMGACKKLDGQNCGAGSECISGFCVDGVCCNTACAGACDACSIAAGATTNGTCAVVAQGQPGNPSCSPFVCDGNMASCPASCTVDGDCVGGRWCNGGSCDPKKAGGAICGGAGECLSGFCADGVCCDVACGGGCDACSMAAGATTDGVCEILGAGTPGNPSCTPYVCDGVLASCPASCTLDIDCAAGNYCDTGTCTAKKAGGVACGGTNECLSGFCADGVCCNSACGDACDACSVLAGAVTDGTCATVTQGQPGNPSCTPYVCDGTATTCPITCTGDADCAGGNWCNGTSCDPKKADGVACSAKNECQSDHCVDGVCCDKPCNGTCQACSTKAGAAADGICGNVGDNTDPAKECAAGCCATGACGTGNCNNGEDCSIGGATECQSGTCLFNVCSL